MYFPGSLAGKRRGAFNMHNAYISRFVLNFTIFHGIFGMHIEYESHQ